MSRSRIYAAVCAACLVGVSLVGCGNDQTAQESDATKTQVALKDNPSVAPEVKSQVEAAVQGETQKMDQYAKDMAAKYKNNPPAAK